VPDSKTNQPTATPELSQVCLKSRQCLQQFPDLPEALQFGKITGCRPVCVTPGAGVALAFCSRFHPASFLSTNASASFAIAWLDAARSAACTMNMLMLTP